MPAMFNCHFRIGGATGTRLQSSDCPKGQGGSAKCIAASLLLHMTPKSHGYFEVCTVFLSSLLLLIKIERLGLGSRYNT